MTELMSSVGLLQARTHREKFMGMRRPQDRGFAASRAVSKRGPRLTAAATEVGLVEAVEVEVATTAVVAATVAAAVAATVVAVVAVMVVVAAAVVGAIPSSQLHGNRGHRSRKRSLRGGYGGSSSASRMLTSFGRLCNDLQPRYDPYVENKKFDEARRRREDERFDELLGLRRCVLSQRQRKQKHHHACAEPMPSLAAEARPQI